MDNKSQPPQQPYYEPPPMYTPPGQASGYPNNSYDPSNPSSSAKATAPPPGLHLPGQATQIPQNHHNQQQQQPAQPMIIYANTTQVNQVTFGPYPMRYTCPNCNAHVMTETHSTPGILTYVLSGALCFLACYLLCCLVPFCVRECKDIEHRCPNCKTRLGLFKRI